LESFWSICLVPTAWPIITAATTKASQPKTAVFQWLALQRPIRAAKLFDRFKGDMRAPWVRVVAPAASQWTTHAAMRRTGPLGVRKTGGGRGARGLRGAQVREHGEHPAVVVVAGREIELGEDARHVLLDCAQGHEQPLCDRLVGAPFGHQLQHLALARRQ